MRLMRAKRPLLLYAMAGMIFLCGILVSLNGMRANHMVDAQVKQMQKTAKPQSVATATAPTASDGSTPPSTVRPSTASVQHYTVGPDEPRYLNIPSLGVHARVLSLGTLASGALATPNNVFDTGWYNVSAKPGQPGAMLIDGHVSSWTSHGVFYGIKNLKAGDSLNVQRGDGQIFTYRVVKTQVYSAQNVDMKAAVTPVTPGKPGLNLITCTGQVEPGTSEFTQRVIVFAEQV